MIIIIRFCEGKGKPKFPIYVIFFSNYNSCKSLNFSSWLSLFYPKTTPGQFIHSVKNKGFWSCQTLVFQQILSIFILKNPLFLAKTEFIFPVAFQTVPKLENPNHL